MAEACEIARAVRRSGVWMRPYQVEGIARCKHGNTLLHFSPGLGKTLVAAAAIRNLSPVMIVIPKVARGVWLKELCRGAGITSLVELEGAKRLRAKRLVLADGLVVQDEPMHGGGVTVPDGCFLVSHDCVSSWSDTVRTGRINMRMNSADEPPIQIPWHYAALVVDESHRFADSSSKRSMGAAKFAAVSDKIILLSGTPDMGGVENLWTQLELLAHGAFGGYYDFIKYFAGAEETKYGLQPGRATHTDELSARMDPYVLTRRQSEVAAYLPKNTRDRIVVPLTHEQAKLLGPIVASAQKALRDLKTARVDRAASFLPGEVVEARRACAEAKVSPVAEMARELHASGERVVVWCWHRAPAHSLGEQLYKAKVPCWIVSGQTPDAQVEATINKWVRDGGVLVATIAKLGEGEDRLVAAAWQLFLEIDWLPQRVQQAERRLLRLSQTRPVNTRFFQLDMPFEQSFMDRVLARAEDSAAVLGGTVATDIGELFGIGPVLSDDELLRRMSDRLG